MHFDFKDLFNAAVYVGGLVFYYFKVNKSLEIRVVKLETSSEHNKKLLEEIRIDVKSLISKRKTR